jgi:hypothetical protein
MCLRVPADALHQDPGQVPESGRPNFWAGVVAMAALVVLAGTLPVHAKPAGDLRPSDAEADGMVHEERQLGLRLLLHDPDPPDSLQHLLRGHAGHTPRQAWWLPR